MVTARSDLSAPGRSLLKDQRGTVLFLTAVAMLLLGVLAVSFTLVASLESKMGVNYTALVKALHIAEGGIDGVKRELIDYVNANGWTGTWTPVLVARSTACSPATGVTFDDVPTGGASWDRTGGDATLFLRDNDTSLGVTWEDGNECVDADGIVTIRADGRLASPAGAFGARKPLAVDVAWSAGEVWDNAVNGGSGAPGAVIQGNAMVYGGVRLVETGGGTAWAMGGTSGIRNNYQNGPGAPASEQLRASTRALMNPTLLAQGDVALNAGLLVEDGTVTFSGGATAGLPQGSLTDRKQTLDLALANDFDPAGVTAIHADSTGPYPNPSAFPRLSDAVGGGDPRTWEAMYNQDGLHITSAPYVPGMGGGVGGNVIDASIGEPAGPGLRTFCVPYPCGTSVTINGVTSRFNLTINVPARTATLVASGIIVFDDFGTGPGLIIGKKTGTAQLDVIEYIGSAVIFVEDGSPGNCGPPPCAGHLTIEADVKTAPASFPTTVNPPVNPPAPGTVNALGFVAERIGLARGADDSNLSGASQLTLAGLFFAQSQLYSCKQNEVLGSLYSRVVTMSCNVPKIAAVKNMSSFVPARIIGGSTDGGTLTVLRWREGVE